MSQYGAFLNSSIVEDFDNYASIVFQRYGKKVKTWFTFNEPHVGHFHPLWIPLVDNCSSIGLLFPVRGRWRSWYIRPLLIALQAYPYDSLYTEGINATTAQYTCIPNVRVYFLIIFGKASEYSSITQLIKAHAVAVQTYRSLGSEGKIAKGKIALKHDGQRPVCLLKLHLCPSIYTVDIDTFWSWQCERPWGCRATGRYLHWYILATYLRCAFSSIPFSANDP